MKKSICLWLLLAVMLGCNKPVDLERTKLDERSADAEGVVYHRTDYCSASFGGSYGGIGYYEYPLEILGVLTICEATTVTVSVQALDVPNRFAILDQNGNYINGTTWQGSASYFGAWGSPFSNVGNTSFNFTAYPNQTYFLRVQTQTPASGSGITPNTDGWWAGISYECCVDDPPPPPPPCDCGQSWGETYSTINSYYVYGYKSIGVCDDVAEVRVDVQALDVPNKFTVVNQHGTYVAGTGWMGSAAYGGPWGSPFSNSGNTYFTFVPNGTDTYYLKVETLTPPNNTYDPDTDGWWAGTTCYY